MKIYLVGGAVRDKLLGLRIKERDWVVVGATADDMLKLGYRQVGKEFPVFLHPKTSEKYALARMERKVQPGYKGFDFDVSPEVKLESDLIRRDLTINAMAEDQDAKLIDPYGGKKDLQQKVLRHVSPAFAEDPVRILRVGRFLARYAYLGFHVAPETYELMRTMVTAGEVDALVAERVWKEMDRALGEKNPEKFFEVLAECGALDRLLPGLDIQGEGIKALKAAATITSDPVVRFAALMSRYNHDPDKLCSRYRVPNEYKELTKLTIKHYHQAHEAERLTANELLSLLSSLDVFRRENRFKKFLLVGEALARIQSIHFNPDWLLACAHAAKSFNVQELTAKGLKGEELVGKIKEGRLERILKWMRT